MPNHVSVFCKLKKFVYQYSCVDLSEKCSLFHKVLCNLIVKGNHTVTRAKTHISLVHLI